MDSVCGSHHSLRHLSDLAMRKPRNSMPVANASLRALPGFVGEKCPDALESKKIEP
jgi:hypothetical protein